MTTPPDDRRRLHRRSVSRQIGTRRYRFMVYHEKSLVADYYLILWSGWDPRILSGAPPVQRRLLGRLSEPTMRIAWSHFKRQVETAHPERNIPFGHAGETWDFHAAWDRALNAARFFDRTNP